MGFLYCTFCNNFVWTFKLSGMSMRTRVWHVLSKQLHDYIAGLSSVRRIGWNGGNVIRIRSKVTRRSLNQDPKERQGCCWSCVIPAWIFFQHPSARKSGCCWVNSESMEISCGSLVEILSLRRWIGYLFHFTGGSSKTVANPCESECLWIGLDKEVRLLLDFKSFGLNNMECFDVSQWCHCF